MSIKKKESIKDFKIICYGCSKSITIDDTPNKCGIYHQYKRNYYCIECFKKIEIHCSVCGIKIKLAKAFLVFPPLEKGHGHNYCSHKCIDSHREQVNSKKKK